MTLWPIASSSWMTIIGWISVSVYFIVVLLVTVLLCGIQLVKRSSTTIDTIKNEPLLFSIQRKAWLLFIWSIAMVAMLLADGIVTVLTLREHQLQVFEGAGIGCRSTRVSRVELSFVTTSETSFRRHGIAFACLSESIDEHH
jgi:hypothetical protein